MRPDAARVLVVEDEGILRRTVADALAGAGFTVAALGDGRDFPAHVARFRPDVAVLDVMLPGRSGLALADHLRRNTRTAVVFVTALDAVTDRLAGFDAGADDYLVKPFVIEELAARVRAVLRRSGRLHSATVSVADLVVDEDAGRWPGPEC